MLMTHNRKLKLYIQNAITITYFKYCYLFLFDFLLAYSKPFVLYVITNGDEMGEIENKGFSLTYRQVPCAV